MKRVVIAALLAVVGTGAAWAGEETNSSYEDTIRGQRPAPRYYPGPVYRPAPSYPREVYRRPPPQRLGDTCQTERRECGLRRSEPVGAYCECVSPSGRIREGRVID
jgi:hypothetical protein